ncbi:AI-2E family transporter [Nanoarchaeota archaeon]
MKHYYKYIFILIFIFLIYLSFLLIKPFLITIFTAALIAYLVYPLFKIINRKVKNRGTCSFILTIFILLLILIPIGFIFERGYDALRYDLRAGYELTKNKLETGTFFDQSCDVNDTSTICSITTGFNNFLSGILSAEEVDIFLEKNVAPIFFEGTLKLVTYLPTLFLHIIVFIFFLYYLLKDGEAWLREIKKQLPLKIKVKSKIANKFRDITKGVIFGHILTAIIQGIVGMIGLLIFGIGAWFFLGLLMILAAMIPFIGAPIVWFPVVLFQFLNALASGNTGMIIVSIVMFLYFFLIVSTIDNFVKPKIIGSRIKIHPLIIFVGIIGGIFVFGIMGVFFGPILLAILFASFEFMRELYFNKGGLK